MDLEARRRPRRLVLERQQQIPLPLLPLLALEVLLLLLLLLGQLIWDLVKQLKHQQPRRRVLDSLQNNQDLEACHRLKQLHSEVVLVVRSPRLLTPIHHLSQLLKQQITEVEILHGKIKWGFISVRTVTQEREQAAISILTNFQTISAMPAYKNWSIEVKSWVFNLIGIKNGRLSNEQEICWCRFNCQSECYPSCYSWLWYWLHFGDSCIWRSTVGFWTSCCP